MDKDAEITKVSWYMGKGDQLWVDVTYKNVSDIERSFVVSVKADDEAEAINWGKGKLTAVKPGEEITSKVAAILPHIELSRLKITIIPEEKWSE